MKLIAHRGLFKNKKEENTIQSFYNAINNDSYYGFECDIRQTKDKKYVIYHDAIIDNKIIFMTKYKDLKKYNLPTLYQILKIKTNKVKMLEIKDYNCDTNKLNRILSLNKNNNIYVMSFYNCILNKIYNLKHNYKIGSLNYKLNNIKDYNYDFICLLDNITSKKEVNKYLKNDKEVFIYGIINEDKFKYSKECFYITDLKI